MTELFVFVPVIGREGEPTGGDDIGVRPDTRHQHVEIDINFGYDGDGDPLGAWLAPSDARRLAALLLNAADRLQKEPRA